MRAQFWILLRYYIINCFMQIKIVFLFDSQNAD